MRIECCKVTMQYPHAAVLNAVTGDSIQLALPIPVSAMAKLVVVVAVVVALAMKMPTFSAPNSTLPAKPLLPDFEHIDGKLQALAANKKIGRKQTLRDFLMGELPNIVTYEVYTVAEGFTAHVQVGDHFQFHSAHPGANAEEAKRSAAVAALWELQWQPAPKPSRKSTPDRKKLRGHFRFYAPNERIKQIMNEDTLQTLKKTRAKVKLLGLEEGNSQNDLLLHIWGREDRFMRAVYKVNTIVNNMPKRLRPKVALHMDN